MATEAERWRLLREQLERLLELPRDQRDDELLAAPRDLREELARLLAREDDQALSQPVARQLLEPPRAEHGTGPYRLIRELSRRAERSSWLAVRDDGEFQRRVYLVVGPRRDDDDEERRRLGSLRHPALARFLEGGSQDDVSWFAFEYEESSPLPHEAELQALSWKERLERLIQACDAVEEAHGQLLAYHELDGETVQVTPDDRLWIVGQRLASPTRGRPQNLRQLALLAEEVLRSCPQPLPRERDLRAVLARAQAGGYSAIRELGNELRALGEHRPVQARPAGRLQRWAWAMRRRPILTLAGWATLLLGGGAVALGAAGWWRAQAGWNVEQRQQSELGQLVEQRKRWLAEAEANRAEQLHQVNELRRLSQERELIAQGLRASEALEREQLHQLELLVQDRLRVMASSLAQLGPRSATRRRFLENAFSLLKATRSELSTPLLRRSLELLAREAAELEESDLAARVRVALTD